MRQFVKVALGGLLLTGLLASSASAQEPDKKGPCEIKLGSNLATLKLPKDFAYINKEHTQEILKKQASDDPNSLGLIYSMKKGDEFSVFLSFDETGYVEDTDADQLKPEEIIEGYKQGTEASNEERKKRGIPALHVVGWETQPKYEKAKHIVVWSLLAQREGSSEKSVNYNTRMLGRKGVLEVNLVCQDKELNKYKEPLNKILDGVSYDSGNRYEDYVKGDKISAGGIAALVAGGFALKKLGVLAFLGGLFKPLLLLGKKAIVFVIAGVYGIFSKLFGKKKDDSVAE